MTSPPRHHWKRYLGVALIGLSGIWFAGLFVVPALPLALHVKGGLALALIILMEASFWLGSAIVGKQVVARAWQAIKARRAAKRADRP